MTDNRQGARLNMARALLLIAETDETGGVAALWRLGPADRIPRPLGAAAARAEDVRRAEIHGAPREAVLAWLARAQSGDRAGCC